jgi:nuclear pore complex protein Nup50
MFYIEFDQSCVVIHISTILLRRNWILKFFFFSQNGATKNPFAAFGGFKASSTNSAPSFSFLTNLNKPSDTSSGAASKDTRNDSRSSEYYSKLTGLNQSVSRWIKSHVDGNPLCILTPIFRDYERHLDEINERELKRQHQKGADTAEKKIKSPEKSTPESSVTEWCVCLYAIVAA